MELTVRGVKYRSVTDACKKLGLSDKYGAIGKRKERRKITWEQAIEEYLSGEDVRTSLIPVEINGKKYPSVLAACKAFGADYQTVNALKNRMNTSLDLALKEYLVRHRMYDPDAAGEGTDEQEASVGAGGGTEYTPAEAFRITQEVAVMLQNDDAFRKFVSGCPLGGEPAGILSWPFRRLCAVYNGYKAMRGLKRGAVVSVRTEGAVEYGIVLDADFPAGTVEAVFEDGTRCTGIGDVRVEGAFDFAAGRIRTVS